MGNATVSFPRQSAGILHRGYLSTVIEPPKRSRGRPVGVANRAREAAPKRSRAGRPTAVELERRKRRVLEVATEMFIERGYSGTTLLDIARASGVATRTLAQHFGDKEDLFREVIYVGNPDMIEPLVLEDDDDLRTALFKGGVYACKMSLNERSISLTRLMIAESARFPEMIGEAASALYRRFLGEMIRLFQDLAERGLIPQGDHEESAELFADLLVGSRMIMSYFGWVQADTANSEIERKIDLFIGGRFGDAVGSLPSSH